MTTEQTLYNSIESMKRVINGLSERVTSLEQIAGIYVTGSTLQTSLKDITDSITDMNKSISTIEDKLQRITLPSETRYYLQESEITDFRTHFRQLRAMMSELDKSRQAFIRLASRYNMTNSSL